MECMHRGGNGPTQVPLTACSALLSIHFQDIFLVEVRWLKPSHVRHLEMKHHWVAKREQTSGVCFLRNKDHFPQSPFNTPFLLHVPLATGGSQAHSETYHWKENWTRQTGLVQPRFNPRPGDRSPPLCHIGVTLILGLWQ